jgi:hypothetical protein
MYPPVQSYQYQLQLMAMFCTVDVLSLLQLTVVSIFKELYFIGYKLTKHELGCC